MVLPPAITTAWGIATGYHPLAAMLGSVAVAALLAKKRAWGWYAAGAAVLGGAWVLGDGRIIEAAFVAAASVPMRAAVVVGALAGAALGYVVPAWAGAFVGRRVVFGWGWPSAIVISLAVSAAFTRMVGA